MQAAEVVSVEVRIDEVQAAQFLGVSKWKLQELCREGCVPFGRLGRHRYFYRSQLETWLRDQVYQPKKKA